MAGSCRLRHQGHGGAAGETTGERVARHPWVREAQHKADRQRRVLLRPCGRPWLLWGSRRHGRGVPGRPLTTRPSTRGARATRPARREIVGRGEEQPGAPRLHRPRPPPRRSVLRGADPPSGRGELQTGAVWAPRVPGAPAAALGEHTVLCCCQRQPPKRAEAASACQALAPLPAGGSLWARPGRAGHRTPGKVLLLGSLP